AVEVDADDFIPAVDGLLAPGALWIVEAGAVDEDIDFAVAGEDRLGHPLHRFRVAHVERFDGSLAAGLADGIRFALQHLGTPPRHDDRRACRCEMPGTRQTHAAAGAGDPGDFAVEIAHRSAPFLVDGLFSLR